MLEAHLKKRIGELEIDANLSMPEGITVLFGPSGAGKSSIIRMIAGLLAPDQGEISIYGDNLLSENGNLPTSKRGIGVVFQDGLLFPHMTVRQNLAFAATPGEEVGSVVSQMDIASLLDRRPRTLSGGEQQRVAIARALLGRPRCLLMDEPLASLDQQRKDAILPFLKRLKDTVQIPILYVTHSVEEAFRLADQIVLIDDGKTGLSGPPETVFGTVADGVSRNPLAGALLTGKLVRHHPDEHLSELQIADTAVFVSLTSREIGERVRIRLIASDISIATQMPKEISILNRLPALIDRLIDQGQQGVGVSLKLSDGQSIAASVTARAAAALNLGEGAEVHALFKTVSVTPENLD